MKEIPVEKRSLIYILEYGKQESSLYLTDGRYLWDRGIPIRALPREAFHLEEGTIVKDWAGDAYALKPFKVSEDGKLEFIKE